MRIFERFMWRYYDSIFLSIYLYIYICVCVCIYIYIIYDWIGVSTNLQVGGPFCDRLETVDFAHESSSSMWRLNLVAPQDSSHMLLHHNGFLNLNDDTFCENIAGSVLRNGCVSRLIDICYYLLVSCTLCLLMYLLNLLTITLCIPKVPSYFGRFFMLFTQSRTLK